MDSPGVFNNFPIEPEDGQTQFQRIQKRFVAIRDLLKRLHQEIRCRDKMADDFIEANRKKYGTTKEAFGA
jgi:hypothetical protein